MDLYTAIRQRRSVRRYTAAAVAERHLARLLDLADGAERPCQTSIRVVLVSGQERVARILARYAGVYGLVQGAPHLLVALSPPADDLARLDVGYVLEQVVLEATRLGLGTCWMTGSYHPDRAAREVETEEEDVVATVALGYPRRDPWARLHDGTVRWLVAARHRRPLEEIVFAGRWGVRWSPQGADPALVKLLALARLAPSARNRQPWRFLAGDGELALALVEPAPIDGGIVMAHVALVAAEQGRPDRWAVRWGNPELAKSYAIPTSVVPVGTFPTAS